MRLVGPEPLALELDVVERAPRLQGRGGDLALALRVQTPGLTFAAGACWVEQEACGAFLGEFGNLARTRSGRATLHFMGGDILEVFAVHGTSDLVIRGRFETRLSAGHSSFPTVLDFHSLLGSESVGQALTDLTHLLGYRET